ncbi:UPF0342 protein [Marinithermofilum abyssi]|uniref:UPF0342 protein GCM10011571_18630 n=1 Tax=Marinithermofilum abyssi TaxID=1571185 RepID=A0A8J2VI13_9BACL|nr:YlbF family regulator [Marinithermofilum abyssi]GGE17216.1 UPF0342 protein [Marinithermofilum abyssi]
MSNVYDQAHALARALRESEELKVLEQAWTSISKDQAKRQLLDQFRQLQMEVQMAQMSGQAPSQEAVKQLNGLLEKVQADPGLKSFLEVEQRLGTMMNDLNRIISEPLERIYRS